MEVNAVDKCKLMREISAVEFAAWELHLYLDTHPCDEKALEMQQKYVERAKELRKELKSLSKEDLAWVLKGFLPPEKKLTRPPTDYEIFIDKYGLKPACPYCTSRLYHPHGLDDYGKP